MEDNKNENNNKKDDKLRWYEIAIGVPLLIFIFIIRPFIEYKNGHDRLTFKLVLLGLFALIVFIIMEKFHKKK